MRSFRTNTVTSKSILGALAICSFVITVPVQGQDLPEGPGKDVVIKVCTTCHGVENFSGKQYSREDWKSVVETMIGYGAKVTSEQAEIIIDYLAKNFGKEAKVAKVINSSTCSAKNRSGITPPLSAGGIRDVDCREPVF